MSYKGISGTKTFKDIELSSAFVRIYELNIYFDSEQIRIVFGMFKDEASYDSDQARDNALMMYQLDMPYTSMPTIDACYDYIIANDSRFLGFTPATEE